MKLEVIAKGLIDVVRINRSQADRIEFCRALNVGGLTPRKWKIKIAVRISKVPINVMVRPSATSFNYSHKDYQKMVKTAKFLAKTKAHGAVFGILDAQGYIDQKRMAKLVYLLANKEKVFHRAFDEVRDFNQALTILKQLEIDALLTSGKKGFNILTNVAILNTLTQQQQVRIVAGGGVNLDNLVAISAAVDEIHVGTAARKNNRWSNKISVSAINQIKSIIKDK